MVCLPIRLIWLISLKDLQAVKRMLIRTGEYWEAGEESPPEKLYLLEMCKELLDSLPRDAAESNTTSLQKQLDVIHFLLNDIASVLPNGKPKEMLNAIFCVLPGPSRPRTRSV